MTLRLHAAKTRIAQKTAEITFIDRILPLRSLNCLKSLPHHLEPNYIAIVPIACRAGHYLEVILIIIEIRMLPPQIVFDAAATQIWARKGIRNNAIARNYSDIAGAIDKNAIAGEEVVAFIKLRAKCLEEFSQLRNEIRRQIANLSAYASITGSETRAG